MTLSFNEEIFGLSFLIKYVFGGAHLKITSYFSCLVPGTFHWAGWTDGNLTNWLARNDTENFTSCNVIFCSLFFHGTFFPLNSLRTKSWQMISFVLGLKFRQKIPSLTALPVIM